MEQVVEKKKASKKIQRKEPGKLVLHTNARMVNQLLKEGKIAQGDIAELLCVYEST